VPVGGLVLERDAFRFQFDSGAFHFLAPVAGRTVGAVFVGRGSYRLTRIHGTVRQEGVSKDFRAVVPIYVEFGKNETARVGLLPLVGEASAPVDVKLKLPKKARKAYLNAHGEVLARD
jgi:hypothetical protein